MGILFEQPDKLSPMLIGELGIPIYHFGQKRVVVTVVHSHIEVHLRPNQLNVTQVKT